MDFYGNFENDRLIAVMSIQVVNNVTLVRHAYVITSCQLKGFGEKLLRHLINLAEIQEVVVGIWTSAGWAVRFYEKNGFQLVPHKSLGKLSQFWKIPDKQAKTSVVLKLKR